jgi:hypothetical protein
VDHLYRVVGIPHGRALRTVKQPIACCVGHDIGVARFRSTISQITEGPVNGGDFLIIGTGIAFIAALCFLFPVLGNILFWQPSAGEDRGIAYVLAIISAVVLLLGLGQLVGLVQSN